MTSGTCSPVCHDRMNEVLGSSFAMRGHVASPLGAMEALPTLAGLSGCHLAIAIKLSEEGWNTQRLGTLKDIEQEVLDTMVRSLTEQLGYPVDVRDLQELIEVAHKAATVAWKAEGRPGSAELLVAHATKNLQDSINKQREQANKRLMEKVPKIGTAKLARWPTRLHRKLELAGGNEYKRDAVEKEERTRWIRELRDLLHEARSPATEAQGSLEGADGSRRFGKGRRVATLRKHVKTWQKVRDWTLATFRHPWPETAEEFVMYLEARAEEPCGRTIPASIFKTLIFMEHAGEFPVEVQWGKAAAVKNALEEINMQLAERAPAFTKRAWHLPVRVVQAMEEAVLDVRLKPYARAYAWFRLVKLWTGMRFADTTGLMYESMEWQPQGLTAVLARTKTTGPGKKVPLLRVWVSTGCWLREETWLSSGFEIWEKLSKDAGIAKRDYFLPCPSRQMDGFVSRMANYVSASRSSQALFNELKVEWGGEEDQLLVDGLGTVWTEHSERATIRTWAEAVGIPEDVRKQMGRWTPTADQAYERTGRSNVLRAQDKIAQYIRRRQGQEDPFDERAVIGIAAEKMREWGATVEDMQEQMGKLSAFRHGRQKKIPRVRIDREGNVREESPSLEEREDEFQPLPGNQAIDEALTSSEDDDAGKHQLKAAVPHGTYVLSVIGRSERRTLHRVGECHRVPGVHYVKFQVVGNDPPDNKEFHRSCKICFPRGMQNAGEISESSPEADELSSSDTSASVEESD